MHPWLLDRLGRPRASDLRRIEHRCVLARCREELAGLGTLQMPMAVLQTCRYGQDPRGIADPLHRQAALSWLAACGMEHGFAYLAKAWCLGGFTVDDVLLLPTVLAAWPHGASLSRLVLHRLRLDAEVLKILVSGPRIESLCLRSCPVTRPFDGKCWEALASHWRTCWGRLEVKERTRPPSSLQVESVRILAGNLCLECLKLDLLHNAEEVAALLDALGEPPMLRALDISVVDPEAAEALCRGLSVRGGRLPLESLVIRCRWGSAALPTLALALIRQDGPLRYLGLHMPIDPGALRALSKAVAARSNFSLSCTTPTD